MILAVALLVYLGLSGAAIQLARVPHLEGGRLTVVVILGVLGQIASLLVPVALMYS